MAKVLLPAVPLCCRGKDLCVPLEGAAISTEYTIHRHSPRLMRPDWEKNVRESLNAFLDHYDPKEHAYAVFDFDNTVSVFDIEDQMLAYQLDTMTFGIRPEDMERVMLAGAESCSSTFAAAAADASSAYRILWDRYGPFSPEGIPQDPYTDTALCQWSGTGPCPDSRFSLQTDPFWIEFHVKMFLLFGIAYRELTPEAADQWMLHHYCGMTPEEICHLAERTAAAYRFLPTCVRRWASPADIPSLAGPAATEWTYGFSVTENMRELIRVLAENGIDVWICSASSADAVRAVIDLYELHDSVAGVLGMTPRTDPEGYCTTGYDLLSGRGYYSLPDGLWKRMDRPQGAVTCGPGKVTAIRNALLPEYDGRGPAACFMDSGGDFAFCTEFDSVRLVLCINRANRSSTDGGSIIARAALYQQAKKQRPDHKDSPGSPLYLLQGRNEQGLRNFWDRQETLLPGAQTPVIFTDPENCRLLENELRDAASARDILSGAVWQPDARLYAVKQML